jgi:hypothetical protein
MQVNAGKCKLCNHTVTYLGLIITRDGIKPQPEKIQGILNMRRPTTQRQVRHFVGMVNFYHLCGQNKKLYWSEEHELAFNNLKHQMAQETMLTYPQFDTSFSTLGAGPCRPHRSLGRSIQSNIHSGESYSGENSSSHHN